MQFPIPIVAWSLAEQGRDSWKDPDLCCLHCAMRDHPILVQIGMVVPESDFHWFGLSVDPRHLRVVVPCTRPDIEILARDQGSPIVCPRCGKAI